MWASCLTPGRRLRGRGRGDGVRGRGAVVLFAHAAGRPVHAERVRTASEAQHAPSRVALADIPGNYLRLDP